MTNALRRPGAGKKEQRGHGGRKPFFLRGVDAAKAAAFRSLCEENKLDPAGEMDRLLDYFARKVNKRRA